MSPSGAEFIRKIRSQVEEVDPSVVQEHLGNGMVLVDVRESEEWDAGHIPGAKHVPRGYLESRIEGAVKDRDQRVVLYCASGQRSAKAAWIGAIATGVACRRTMRGAMLSPGMGRGSASGRRSASCKRFQSGGKISPIRLSREPVSAAAPCWRAGSARRRSR